MEDARAYSPNGFGKLWRENGLSISLAALFIACWVGQSVMGMREYNLNQFEHGAAEIGYLAYLSGSHFWTSTLENWESEFLQMFAFVVLTVFLYQKGSVESKDPNREEAVDRKPGTGKEARADSPRPVRRGGWRLRLYERSLGLAFLVLFLVSFASHALMSMALERGEQLKHGGSAVSLSNHVFGSTFWFESFQNWQSEFLSVWAMVVFTIFLRHRGSPESKPVDAPHSQTGGE